MQPLYMHATASLLRGTIRFPQQPRFYKHSRTSAHKIQQDTAPLHLMSQIPPPGSNMADNLKDEAQTSITHATPNLLGLPVELRLNIYGHLLPDQDKPREDFDVAAFKDLRKLPAKEHEQRKSYSWIFTDPKIYDEGIDLILKSYRIAFSEPRELQACRNFLKDVKEIKLDLGAVGKSKMREAVFTALYQPNLEKLWISTTKRTLSHINLDTAIPHGRIGPHFQGIILSDPIVEAGKMKEQYRKQLENEEIEALKKTTKQARAEYNVAFLELLRLPSAIENIDVADYKAFALQQWALHNKAVHSKRKELNSMYRKLRMKKLDRDHRNRLAQMNESADKFYVRMDLALGKDIDRGRELNLLRAQMQVDRSVARLKAGCGCRACVLEKKRTRLDSQRAVDSGLTAENDKMEE